MRVHTETLVAVSEPDAVVERIAAPDTHVVTLTITEGGYGGGLLLDLLARGLAARDGAPVAVLSCDNVPSNGAATRQAVGAFPGVVFPSTMADRITPASDDPLVVVTEPFSMWVIEAFDGPRPAWERAGALIVPDVAPYEAMKLRVVNAAHSALAALGMPRGHTTVAEAIADPELSDFVAPPARRGARPDRAGRPRDRPRRVRGADARALRQPRACSTGSPRSPRAPSTRSRSASTRPPPSCAPPAASRS